MMKKSSSEAVRLPQRKQWTPPKPSYCSPKPMMLNTHKPLGSYHHQQQQQRLPVTSSYDRLPHTSAHSIDLCQDSFDPTAAPLAAAAALSLASNTFASCLPAQPLASPDELDGPSLERLSTWSFDYSPPGSDGDSSPDMPTFSPPNFYITPSCSPKTRVAQLPSVPPLSPDTGNDRSVFENWEDDEKQERLLSNAFIASVRPMASSGQDITVGGVNAKATRPRAPRRFFHTRASSQQSCDVMDPEDGDAIIFTDVRESGSASADGHTGVANGVSRLQKFSKFVRQTSSSRVPVSQRASDIFFDSRTDRDVFAASPASASDEQHGSMRSANSCSSKPPPRLAKSSARSTVSRDATLCTGLGLENVPLSSVSPLSVVNGRPYDNSSSVATSRSASRASKLISEDERSVTASPALRFDPLRRPRAPFPAASPASSSPSPVPAPYESPILRNAKPLRPIPTKAATLLGTLPGSMYAGAKYTASTSSSSGSSDTTMKPMTRLSTRPSSLAQHSQMPDLPPCPNRMHKLNDIIRPKASRAPRATDSAIQTPPRPARPTQRNIFSLSDDEGDLKETCLVGKVKILQAMSSPPPPSASMSRPPRSSRRSKGPIPDARPPPRAPLPPVPAKDDVAAPASTKEQVQTPPGWTSETPDIKGCETVKGVEDTAKTEKALERQVFEAEVVEDSAEEAQPAALDAFAVQLDVGGLTFATTLDVLCPKDDTVSCDGMTAWLRRQDHRTQETAESPLAQLSPPQIQERRSQNSANSYDDGEDADESGEASASSVASSVPSLSSSSHSSVSGDANDHPARSVREPNSGLTLLRLHTPSNELDGESSGLDRRSGLARTPTSVSMDSAFHHHLDEELKDAATQAHDSGSTIEAWRNVYHSSHTQTTMADKDSNVPTFVFSSTGSAHAQRPRRLRIALPAQRNPLCYPAILYALQNQALPAYFAKRLTSSTAEQRRRAALLRDVRDEAAWLGYPHLVALCDRYV